MCVLTGLGFEEYVLGWDGEGGFYGAGCEVFWCVGCSMGD